MGLGGGGGRGVGKMVIREYGFHGRVINGLGDKHCLNVHVLISCLLWFVPADNFTAVFHSLDVWHKAKSIRKCLAKVIVLFIFWATKKCSKPF